MSRLRRIADRDRIFFVTTNMAPGIAPLAPAERELVLGQLSRQQADQDLRLFAYVVMPTHVHLLLAPNRVGLGQAMHRLKRFTGHAIKAQRRYSVPIWQPRFYDFVLRRAGDFWDKLAYIHDNPVAAKLVPRCIDWRWSSAREYGGFHADDAGGYTLHIDKIDLPPDRCALLNPVWPD